MRDANVTGAALPAAAFGLVAGFVIADTRSAVSHRARLSPSVPAHASVWKLQRVRVNLCVRLLSTVGIRVSAAVLTGEISHAHELAMLLVVVAQPRSLSMPASLLTELGTRSQLSLDQPAARERCGSPV